MQTSDFHTMRLPCGGTARFDVTSGISFRCEDCGAVVGSMGQPRECADEMHKWSAYQTAGLWAWNYQLGAPVNLNPVEVEE